MRHQEIANRGPVCARGSGGERDASRHRRAGQAQHHARADETVDGGRRNAVTPSRRPGIAAPLHPTRLRTQMLTNHSAQTVIFWALARSNLYMAQTATKPPPPCSLPKRLNQTRPKERLL